MSYLGLAPHIPLHVYIHIGLCALVLFAFSIEDIEGNEKSPLSQIFCFPFDKKGHSLSRWCRPTISVVNHKSIEIVSLSSKWKRETIIYPHPQGHIQKVRGKPHRCHNLLPTVKRLCVEAAHKLKHQIQIQLKKTDYPNSIPCYFSEITALCCIPREMCQKGLHVSQIMYMCRSSWSNKLCWDVVFGAPKQ